MFYLPAILIGRAARSLIRKVRPGGGSALPGLILSKIAPGLLAKTLNAFPDGLVVVTGSAGKSTTTKMLVAIAREHGKTVFTNPSTANIEQGFYSAILERSNVFGRINGDVAILEMDEGHAAEITKRVAPRQSTILNVLEDQLDRFVDPAVVRDKLLSVAERTQGTVLLNADDQNTVLIAREVKTQQSIKWFGIAESVLAQSKHGLGAAPTYLDELPRPHPSAEIMSVNGTSATARIDDQQLNFDLPNRGLHYALDSIAALQSAQTYLGDDFDAQLAAKTLDDLPPVFARGEIARVGGEDVEFILVQNPMSFQLNLDNLTTNPEQIMVAIGRDVHDPSWLWTVDMSNLSHADVVSGYNFAEIGLRMAYSDIPMGLIEGDLEKAVEAFFALPTPTRGMKTVIFSADAMRRTRRILGFTDPEAVDR
ncbi:MAG: MurT ligase domain-containing protein [Rhodoluna sp.]